MYIFFHMLKIDEYSQSGHTIVFTTFGDFYA